MKRTVSEATVRVRMPEQLRTDAEVVFRDVGLTPSAAMRIFYTEVVKIGGLPFATKIPNKATATAIADALGGRDVFGEFPDVESAFAELQIRGRTGAKAAEKVKAKEAPERRARTGR